MNSLPVTINALSVTSTLTLQTLMSAFLAVILVTEMPCVQIRKEVLLVPVTLDSLVMECHVVSI